LIIINRLNTSGSGSLPTPTSVAGLTEYFYIDTNGDGSVAPIDVIQVINFLNNPTGSPEGEGATSFVVDPVATLPRNVSSRAPASNPQRPEARNYEEGPAKIPAVGEAALRSNATTSPRVKEHAGALDAILDGEDLSLWDKFFE